MSDYEEEHFPVGIPTSFSSSFDANYQESASGTDFPPIRRSRSEFYRGERITVDTTSSRYEDEFPNVSSEDEFQNSVDDNCDLVNQNSSYGMKLVSNSSHVTALRNNVCSDIGLQHVTYQPEFDRQIESSISENCTTDSKCVSGYDNENGISGTKVLSPADSDRESAKQADMPITTGQNEALSHSQQQNDAVNDIVRRRTVSEIRNNIPDIGNVRSCDDASGQTRQPSPESVLRGEFARFRKRSPGVAKRLEATTPSRGESMDLSVLSSTEVCEADEAAAIRCHPEHGTMPTQTSVLYTDTVAATGKANVTEPATMDEKGTSVQKGLTKCLEHNDVIDLSRMSRTWDSLSDDSAHRTDPFRYSGMLPDAVLFTTSDDPVADQTIRLSPELTECDSDNVSTLEEDSNGDSVNGCLPVVEDGLSCSDTDEISSAQNTCFTSHYPPADDAVAMETSPMFPVSETEVMDFFSGTADNNCDTTNAKDSDPVERAIRDIRLAMERSKGFSGGSPAKSQSLKPQSARHDSETVWVSRAE